MEILAERLLALRKENSWKQDEAAKQLDIAFRSYRRYEAGEREPSISALVHIADVYNISLDYLTGRTDDPTPPTPPGATAEEQNAPGT